MQCVRPVPTHLDGAAEEAQEGVDGDQGAVVHHQQILGQQDAQDVCVCGVVCLDLWDGVMVG
jgi:hypothetical protein